MWESKTVIYRGGVVTFDLPAHWTEEYEPKGGGTFYEDTPDSGTLRLNMLGFKIAPHQTLSEQVALMMARDGFEPLQEGLGIRRVEKSAVEDGEPLVFYRWEVLIPIEPDEFSIAIFAHTVLGSEVNSELTKRELEFIDDSVRRAQFNQSNDYYIGDYPPPG
jgi:hypothetical protein